MVEEERARDGLEHLQAAARELIAAARAMLDVAEDLVDEPGAVQDVVEFLGAAARSAVRSAGLGGRSGGGDGDDGDDGGATRIEHIDVS